MAKHYLVPPRHDKPHFYIDKIIPGTGWAYLGTASDLRLTEYENAERRRKVWAFIDHLDSVYGYE